MDSIGAICVPTIRIRKADPDIDFGPLLFAGAAGRLAPTSGASWTVGVARTAPDPEAAGPRERLEFFSSLCRDVVDGGHALEGGGCYPPVFIDVIPLRVGNDVGVIA